MGTELLLLCRKHAACVIPRLRRSISELFHNMPIHRVRRVAAFLAVTALIWLAYFTWRPPAPMLGLRHIEHLNPNQSFVSLTIDDAPHPLTTPLLLAALRRANVKATFFVVGDGLQLYPELARRIVADGHELGNHSHYHPSHPNLAGLPPAKYDAEVRRCFTAIRALGKNTRLFRPPGGGLNRPLMQYLYDRDITLAWWSNNIGDWARQPAWRIAYLVNLNLRPGDILLLHDSGLGTAQAIPRIAYQARQRGLEFVPMPEAPMPEE